MRGGRSLVVLLRLAAGLGAYIYFVESRRDPAGTEVAERVFDVAADDIVHLEMTTPDAEVVVLEKTDGSWRLVAPVSARADQTAVGSVTSSLASMDIVRVLDEAPGDLTPYGLVPPRMTVMFRTSEGPSDYRINMGSRTPTGSDLYAQVAGESRLLLVASYQEDALNRSTFSLRDKSLLAVAQDDVDRVVIDRPTGADVTLAREAGSWSLTDPAGVPADDAAVTDLISRLVQARMSAIVAEGDEVDAADPAQWGLETPQLAITLGAGSTRATLAIGSEGETGSRYARDLSRPLVFAVPEALLADLDKQPDDLRVRDVFFFKTFSALDVDISWNDTTRSFVRQPAESDDALGGAWTQTAPEAGDVNETAMTDLLNSLSSLRADRFVASPPPIGDDMVVEARSGDPSSPTEERVVLRKSGDTVYALVEGSPDAAVVSTADFDRAVSQLEDLSTSAE